MSFCSGSTYVSCLESEREALLKFKQDLKDPSNRLVSWNISDGDCCKWAGVICHNTTGHVLQLLLGNPYEMSKHGDSKISWFNGEIKMIPHQIRNLSNLQYLDLNWNFGNYAETLSWPSSLSSLNHIDLTGVNLDKVSDWLLAINSLPSLKVLKLAICQLHYFPSLSVSSDNLSSLTTVDLSRNQLGTSVMPWVFGLSDHLVFLDLSLNYFEGPIPRGLGNLTSLRYLDLSANHFNSTIPEWFFSRFGCLEFLSLWSNLLQGNRFPSWLLSQKSLLDLDISNSRIQDTIPDEFWESSSQLYSLNFSNNRISGEIPNLSKATYLQYLDLSSNNFYGPLPPLSSNELYGIDLSNNSFSGSIFQFLCHRLKESKELEILDLGENILSREIPDCWMTFQSLEVLNLGNNNFTGNLPLSMGTLSSLQSLHLQKNTLFGKIPESFKNCTQLLALNIADNQFSGNVPAWIGESFSRIIILILRSNKFDGHFPTEFCLLSSLQIIDLASNKLSEGIPRCISNLSAMVTTNYSVYNDITYSTNFRISIEKTSLVMKGRNVEYSSNLNLVRSIDISENNFSGGIPAEVTKLLALQSLNWSHNHFTGRFPENIGAMRSLESIDFSYNKLYGEIPQSTSSLTFLNHLNLSYNNLSGKIPLSTQLQSFDASCFLGNANLCGSPLSKNCTENVSVPQVENGDEDDEEVNWFIVSMALGFVDFHKDEHRHILIPNNEILAKVKGQESNQHFSHEHHLITLEVDGIDRKAYYRSTKAPSCGCAACEFYIHNSCSLLPEVSSTFFPSMPFFDSPGRWIPVCRV
ncbi:hypothetical protein WN943_023624 [Citrus x changshan-huyou]